MQNFKGIGLVLEVRASIVAVEKSENILNCVYFSELCLFTCDLFLHGSLEVCVPNVLKVHRSFFIPVPGTCWTYSVGKSCSSVLGTFLEFP